MKKIICGTGHRPKFLPWKYKEKGSEFDSFKKKLIDKLNELEPDIVISGMAIGFDTYLAEATLELNIPLKCYIPYSNQGENWPSKAKERYLSILDRADFVFLIQDEYSFSCFLERDQAMVDDSDEVIALWNPKISQGGTYYTVNYARKCAKIVHNLWDNNYEL